MKQNERKLFAALLKDAREFCTLSHSALSNGISRSRIYNLLKKGIEDCEAGIASDVAKFAKEFYSIQKAKINELQEKIALAEKNWQAYAWLLERRFPSEFTMYSGEFLRLTEEIENLKKLIAEKMANGNR